MTTWNAHVRRHLRERGLTLPDAVVEELADHLEDAWDARPAAAPARAILAFERGGSMTPRIGQSE
jgi:hypothetical protein